MRNVWLSWTLFLLFVALWTQKSTTALKRDGRREERNHHAVLVGTSRYWHNYRHMGNVMGFYHILKEAGMRDDRIMVMQASDAACDVRNSHPEDVVAGQIGAALPQQLSHLDIDIDYHGLDVTAASFAQVMTGRHDRGTPARRRMDSDETSNILLYMTGHGGDGFLKFHDVEEMGAEDVARIINDMAVRRRYKEMLVFIDTCQAETIFELITAPRVTVVSSSQRGENSYASSTNSSIGVPPSDRFTLSIVHYLSRRPPLPGTRHTVRDLMRQMDPHFLFSTVTARMSPGARRPEEIYLSEFFAPPSLQPRVSAGTEVDNDHILRATTR